jgi:tetratricopeptide (TPR) repeat protein
MNRANHYLRNPDDYYAGGAKKVYFGTRLRRRFFLLLGLTFAVLLIAEKLAFARISSVTTRPGITSAGIAASVNNLGSDDSMVREQAASQLIAIGAPARPQVLKAVRSDDPGLREEAARVLLALPWAISSDPEVVKKVLEGYGSPEIPVRMDRVRTLAIENGGIPALLRLLNEDPSPDVRWAIVHFLRVSDRQATLAPFRTAEPDPENPQTMELCGYARWSLQMPGSMGYLTRCAELELAHPTDDGGEFDFVIRLLVGNAIQQKNFVEAVGWRRRELARGSPVDDNGTPDALLELFALQANYGPIAGLDDDLKRAGDVAAQPKLLYCLSQLHLRQDRSDEAAKERETAFNASLTRQARYEVADFLFNHGFNDLAEREDRKFLEMETAGNGDNFRYLDENVHFQLASIAIAHGDDETAGHEQETAMRLGGNDASLSLVDEQGRISEAPASEMWAEIHWRYMRAAASRHDPERAEAQLQQILALKPTDTDIAIDLVPQLKQKHRDTEAAALFDSAYDALKTRVDASPQDPDALNGIAWLCGNCGEHLADADRWATAAVAATPGNAAVIDTLATVNYAEGKFYQAVELETHASSLDPADSFMKGQLQKFKKAADGVSSPK